ncbi:beta strand repeat-containing protein, partial [Methanobrevibacter cuticularis]|uniref:beta strand repeat-containing protein n=1 Tax=Methanobrevibacter cuticularis TaxID=47311 RepID=UPI000B0013F1
GVNTTISGVLANYSGINQVTVTVDGIQFNVAVDSTGGWSLNYATVRTGSVSVVVSFAGNDNYTSFTNSTTFTVAKNSTNSTIVVNPNPVSIGNNVTISGVLANHTGINQVAVTVDGLQFIVAVDSTGGWSVVYTTVRSGSVSVVVGFAGNDNYTGFTNSTTFTVAKNSTNSTIVVSPNPVSIGNNVTISGVLANHTGINQVAVTVDGLQFIVAVDSTGGWSVVYTTVRSGSVSVVVGFAGNDNYTGFTNSTNFTVNMVNKSSTNSTIVVNPNPVNIGNNITVSGQLANYTGINQVTVTVDGTTFANVAVDGSGYWVLNYTTNRTGNLTVVVSFAGNENYTSFTNTTNFIVNMANKSSTNSTILVDNVQIGENATISGQLANYTGINQVTVTVDGKQFNIAVNSTGGWSMVYTTVRTGSVSVVVGFAGNDNYTSFTNFTSFNVGKLGVKLTVNVLGTVKVGKTMIIDGVLVDENGNPVANALINVTVDGKVYSLTTD